MTALTQNQQYALDAGVTFNAAVWSAVGNSLGNVAKGALLTRSALLGLGIAGSTTATSGGDFNKAAVLTGMGILTEVAISFSLVAIGVTTLPISASIGITVGVGTLYSLFGNDIYDASEKIYDYFNGGGFSGDIAQANEWIEQVGTMIGNQLDDLMNTDWEAIYNDGKEAFEGALEGVISDAVTGIQAGLQGLVNAGNDFAGDVADIIDDIANSAEGLEGWISDNFGDLFDNIPSVIAIPSDSHDFIRPDIGSVPIDPLVLDLDGDGVTLNAVAGSTAYFDLDNDGIREQVGWVGANDGLVVRDLNNNGTIDGLDELIGTETQDAYTMLEGFDSNSNKLLQNYH